MGYNTALSTRGEICLCYDLLDFFSPTDKFIEFLTDGMTELGVTASSGTRLKSVYLYFGSVLKRGSKLRREFLILFFVII